MKLRPPNPRSFVLKPLGNYDVVNDFLQMYGKAKTLSLSNKADIGRIVSLRCSQLPFCPTSLLLNYLYKGLTSPMDLMGSYYTSVGSAVHEVMQRYLSKSGCFLADYVCHECGTVHHMTTKHECCGFDTHYHEVLIDCCGIVGHIDGIFRDRNGDWWILDFKTCSVAGAAKKKVSPGVGYIEQVESYAYLLWKQYGIEVKGTMLVFLPRDDPKQPVVWAQTINRLKFKEIGARLRVYRKLHEQAMAVTTAREVWKLASHKCSNQYCRYCKLGDSALKQLVKRAFPARHPLPLGDLQVPVKPEVSLVLYHESSYHNKVTIPVPHIKDFRSDFEGLGRAVYRSMLKLKKLHERNIRG